MNAHTIISLLLLLLPVKQAFADKMHIPTEMMIEMADQIVVGKILKVNPGACLWEVERVIKGKISKDKIKVHKFWIWTCDPRDDYAEGQHSVLFLKKKGNGYTTLNGGDGEVRMLGDSAIVRGFSKWEAGRFTHLVHVDSFAKAVCLFRHYITLITDTEEQGYFYPYYRKYFLHTSREQLLTASSDPFYQSLIHYVVDDYTMVGSMNTAQKCDCAGKDETGD